MVPTIISARIILLCQIHAQNLQLQQIMHALHVLQDGIKMHLVLYKLTRHFVTNTIQEQILAQNTNMEFIVVTVELLPWQLQLQKSCKSVYNGPLQVLARNVKMDLLLILVHVLKLTTLKLIALK